MRAFPTVDSVDVFVGDDDEIIIRQGSHPGDEDARHIYIPVALAAAFKQAFETALKQAKAEGSL